MNFLNVAIVAVGAVAVLSIVYRLVPHRCLSDKKPLIAFFPKYLFPIDRDIAVLNLEASGFKNYKGTNTFVRGYFWGDFLASITRLNVVIKGDAAFLHVLLMGILFDTGDSWKIAKEIQKPS